MSITILIIIITSIVSLLGFYNQNLIDNLIFYPPAVQRGQWYRFLSCGLIHADFGHLIFNMISFYFFGEGVERFFVELAGNAGKPIYILLYVSSLIVSILPTYFKNKDNGYYRSLGASGAVSAIIFAGLALIPSASLYMYFIPIPIPGFVFAPLYLIISFIMDRRGGSNINHSAHIWGAIYGMAFVIVLSYVVNYPVFQNFIYQVRAYLQDHGM